MSSGVSLVHQIGALLLLALGSLAIAFLPLSLLHVVYRKKRRRLREEELQLQRSRQQQLQQQKLGTLSSSAPSTSAGVHHHPELGISPTGNAGNDRRQKKRAPNNTGGGHRRRSFIANWFGLEAQSLNMGNDHSLSASRTLSTRSSSDSSARAGGGGGGSLYQHFSEVALNSTLAIPSIVLELIRSLDGGLLLAALFLILLPQLRTSFDTFMSVHVNGGGGVKLTGTKPFQTLPLTANETAAEANLTSGSASILSQAAAMRQAAEAEAAVQSAHLIAAKSVSPVPLVELILCLAFFALHFIEEFAQLCLRYRKYFWACNSSLVYSSSNGTCESFSSLDYRLSRTKRFLIDCSRKTSSSTSTTANSSARTSPQTISSGGGVNDDVSRTAALSQQLKIQFSVVTEKDDEVGGKRIATEHQQQQQQMQTEVKKVSEASADDDEELDTVCENHGLQDSLQLYGHLGQHQTHHNQADFEPNSLLTSESSSSYLPSYYWPPVQTSEHQNRRQSGRAAAAGGDREFYQESGQDSMPYEGDEAQNDHQQQQQYYPCPCHHHHPPVHPFVYHQQRHPPSDDGTATTSSSTSHSSSSSSSSSGVFTKIFLPYTTLATSTPALYFCEGILIAIQPSAAMLWLMLAVILVHKLVTGLLVSFELHERTTGRQRQLPSSTAVLFTVLPLVGYLTVLFLNGLFLLRAKDRVQASSVVVTAGVDHGGTSSSSSSSSSTSSSVSSGGASSGGTTSTTTTTTTLEHTPMEVTAVRVLLFAVASAALLHLVLLIIQRNLATFQPQLQFRKGVAPCPSAPPPVHHHNHNHHQHHQQQPTSQVHLPKRESPSAHETDNREKRSSTLKTSASTTTTTTSTAAKSPSSSSSSSPSSSSNTPLNRSTQPPPPPPPTQRATTLAQVPMCAMTSSSTCSNADYRISQSPNGPYHHRPRQHSQPAQSVSLDPEIVTNPPRYGVLHHFTMYTGFIIVLMAIAFLNMNSLKV